MKTTVARPSVPLDPAVHIVEDDEDVEARDGQAPDAGRLRRSELRVRRQFLAQMPIADAGLRRARRAAPGRQRPRAAGNAREAADVLPIVFVTGHGDIPMSVRAIKAGAVDFLTKPVPESRAARRGRPGAWRATPKSGPTREHVREVQAQYDRLTPREREVFAHLIGGQLNKQVAFDLGTAERTIKAHRHSIMEKLGAESIVDLTHVAAELHIAPIRAKPGSRDLHVQRPVRRF